MDLTPIQAARAKFTEPGIIAEAVMSGALPGELLYGGGDKATRTVAQIRVPWSREFERWEAPMSAARYERKLNGFRFNVKEMIWATSPENAYEQARIRADAHHATDYFLSPVTYRTLPFYLMLHTGCADSFAYNDCALDDYWKYMVRNEYFGKCLYQAQYEIDMSFYTGEGMSDRRKVTGRYPAGPVWSADLHRERIGMTGPAFQRFIEDNTAGLVRYAGHHFFTMRESVWNKTLAKQRASGPVSAGGASVL